MSNGLGGAVSDSSSALPSASVEASLASSEPQIYLPTYPPMEFLPLAAVGGRLVEDEGCLWIESEAGRALALWPSGSMIEDDDPSLVVVNSAGARAVVGTNVTAAGGEYRPEQYEMVVQLLGGEVREACRADDFYLLVYDVRTEGG